MNLNELKAAVDRLLSDGVPGDLPVAYSDCEYGPTMIGSVEAKDESAGSVETIYSGRYRGPFVLLDCGIPEK